MREAILRRSPAATTLSPPVTGLLQRTCSCGGSAGPAGECEECKKKKLQRSATGAATKPSAHGMAPPIVHDVLRSTGKPLDAATRAYMEPRFGHSFSDVRIHADAHAAASARAVDARAYTVSNRIVFGEGQFSPASAEGRRLLGHELTHVVQQKRSDASLGGELRIGAVNDPLEHEAERQAGSLDSASTAVHGAAAGSVQRAPRTPSGPAPGGGATPPSGSTPPAAPPPVAAAPAAVCGPDVTTALGAVVSDMNSEWASWNTDQREDACWALENPSCGPVAWDIDELHNRAWIQDYRPACSGPAGHTPACGNTVQVGSDCHFAGSANYVIFGRQCQLCDIWRRTMHAMIAVHKVHWSGMDADYGPAVGWADAGYDGWPGAPSPSGDRNACAPTCATPFGPSGGFPSGRFEFHWAPTHSTESLGADCEQMIEQRRFMKDNPPDYSGAAGF